MFQRKRRHRSAGRAPRRPRSRRRGLAEHFITEVERLRGVDLAYGRVDLMRWQGDWVISELELTEPGLYLDDLPGNGEAFAAVVADRLGR